MKLICAWCKKVIRDGPEEILSHGICRDCARAIARRDVPAPFSLMPGWIVGNLIAGAVIALLLLVAALCSEGLHWISGGKIPRFIPWEQPEASQPAKPEPFHHKRH